MSDTDTLVRISRLYYELGETQGGSPSSSA
jgi:hypothetical protein